MVESSAIPFPCGRGLFGRMTPNQRDSDGRTDAHDTIIDAFATRRRFLAGTAAIGTTALAGCTGDGGDGGGDGGSGGGSGGQSMNPDVDVLNYALTLEHLEHQFYKAGLEAFSESQLTGATSGVGAEVNAELVARLETVRAHEKGHVDTITGVVEDLGGEPVGAAEYNFPLDDPAKFLTTASVLENTGVAAYKGAAPAIKSNDLLASALGIHSVEARHASFLNAVTGKSPYPNAFDAPKSPAKVTEAANPFFEADIAGSVGDLSGDGEPTADRKKSDDRSDVDVLNYALTLEHLEHQFYKAGIEKFSDSEIRNADVLSDFDDAVTQSVPKRLKTVRDHEKAHVDVITDTVNKLEGKPVGKADYNFPLDNPTKFIQTARVLENVGVAAYAGAAPSVKANAVFVAAAKIHSVEARHAGFLNELNGKSPYPKAVDQAMTKKEVLEAADPFFESDMS
jgi:rubrerythrin